MVLSCLFVGKLNTLMVLAAGAWSPSPTNDCKQLFSRGNSHMARASAVVLRHPMIAAWVLCPQQQLSHPACCGLADCCCCCAGSILMAIAWPVNLGALGNSLAIWLGISPWQLFFYVFLPPLLLDAAVRIDWYLFKKVRVLCRVQLAAAGDSCCCACSRSSADAAGSCPARRRGRHSRSC